MADEYTPNLGLTKPDVGASDDTWGEKLNTNFDLLDAAVAAVAIPPEYVTETELEVTLDGYITDAELATIIGELPVPPSPATITPIIEGVGAVGISLKYAREDHVHPTGGGGGGGGDASVLVSDTPPVGAPPNSLWWESDTGQLYINYNDGTSTQWVLAVPQTSAEAIGAATTVYVDAQDALRVLKAGDTMTGPLAVNNTPGDQPISVEVQSDAYTSTYTASSLRQYNNGAIGSYGGLPLDGLGQVWFQNVSNAMIAVNGVSPLEINVFANRIARFGQNFIDLVMPTTAPSPLITDKSTRVATTEFVKAYAAPFDALAYNGMQINGSMEVSQEKGFTPSVGIGYACDGWLTNNTGTAVLTVATTASNYFPGLTNVLWFSVPTPQPSLGAGHYIFFAQKIEGYRTSRLGFGTAAARPLTIGFWSMHHRTGIYSVVITNGAFNRSYVATYTQNVADAPEYKTVTVPGCTDGVWAADNAMGLQVSFVAAVGTTYIAPSANVWYAAGYLGAPGQVNGVAATSDAFRIGGVLVIPGIEAPTAAQSALIMRPYDQELMTCKRYYSTAYASLRANAIMNEMLENAVIWPVEMRAQPTTKIVVPGTVGNVAATYPQIASINNSGARFMLVALANGDCYSIGTTVSADARL